MEDCPGGLSATDGVRILINPVEFIKLSKDEQQTVLVHEAWHCASGCFERVGKRDALKWNLAQDVMIANAMESESFTLLKLQEEFFGKIKLDRSKYAGMTSEAIYAALPDPPQQPGGQGGNGKGQGQSSPSQSQHWNGNGCVKPHTPEDGEEGGSVGELNAKWKQNVVEAAQVAKQAGKESGAWSELIKAAMPKPPFHLRLFEYLARGLGGDTTFDTFNRRYLWQGMYLPTEQREIMGRVSWVCDTSGSMGSAELKQAFGFARSFRDEHPCVFDLIECDYGVANHKVYEEWEALPSEFKARGRGGTSFNAPFEMLKAKGIVPRVIIYVTDGYGECSAPKPECDVLWVVVGGNTGFKPPFGDVVMCQA